MKQYKSAYVLGKYAPFHAGHKYLIDTAIENSEKVTVVVSSLPTETIPGDIRFKWVKDQYSGNPNVTVVHCDEVLPQYPEESYDFWNIWVDVVKRYCPDDIDVIFTSELYGYVYAEHLGIKHHMVDLERTKYFVSGTKIRKNPFDYWNFIPNHVKPYFVKRVAIMGPESTGKTTLTHNLAKYFKTVYVEEYGRTLYEENEGKLSEQDFKTIAETHRILEKSLVKQANKFLFSDTEIITTQIFFKMYYPEGQEINEKYLKLVEMSGKPYDLYILLEPDCEAIQDGTRQFLKERWKHYDVIKNNLIERNLKFVEVGGSYDNRFHESLMRLFNIN